MRRVQQLQSGAGARAVVAGLACLAFAGPAAAQTTLTQQQTTANLNWKRAFEKEPPPPHPTEHFLIYGKIPAKALPEIGEMLEAQYAAAFKALKLDEKRDVWRGKLAVYLLPEKQDY